MTAALTADTREPQGTNLVNARWERQPDSDREAAELCAATLAKLHTGEYASVRDLVEGLCGATGAEVGPTVVQLVAAARRLATAWSELCDNANRQEQALSETRDRAARFTGQLQGMVGAVRDALLLASSIRRPAPRARLQAIPAPAAAHTRGVFTPRLVLSAANETRCASGSPPVLAVSVLGPFRTLLNGRLIEDWPGCRGKAIFKYLLLHRKRTVARDALMERFWPDAEPEAARNNLNVAVHRLRRALGGDGFPFVLFSGGNYALNPKLEVSIDADAFLRHAERASELERAQDLDGTIREYTASVALYQGDLLAEDRHDRDEWLLPLRQQFRDKYLHVLDRLGRIQLDRQDIPACTAACAKILAVDACNEGAHRMLMRGYARLGQPQLAQQQYQACVQALNRELGIPTSAETTELYRQIVRRDVV
jgi:DNA-binding SARP family transcriptional activator